MQKDARFLYRKHFIKMHFGNNHADSSVGLASGVPLSQKGHLPGGGNFFDSRLHGKRGRRGSGAIIREPFPFPAHHFASCCTSRGSAFLTGLPLQPSAVIEQRDRPPFLSHQINRKPVCRFHEGSDSAWTRPLRSYPSLTHCVLAAHSRTSLHGKSRIRDHALRRLPTSLQQNLCHPH